MPSFTERFTEDHIPLAVLHADSYAAGEHNTGFFSMQNYHRIAVVIDVGDMAQGATLDADLEASDAAAGGTVTTVKTITQLTQAGGDGDDLICIECRSEEIVNASGNALDESFVNLELTIANAAVELSAIVYGIISRYKPVSITGWTEIVD